MKHLTKGIVLIVILMTNITTASPIINIENFTKLPASRDAQISPDGKHLSIIMRKKNEDLLAVLDRKTMKPKGVFKVQGYRKSVGKVYWINNKRLVYTVTESSIWNKTQIENGELIGVNVDGSKHKVIFGYNSGQGQTGSRLNNQKAENGNQEIIDLMKGDDKHILIAFYPWLLDGNVWRSNPDVMPILYKLNVFTGNKRKVGNLPVPFADAIVDNNGEVRFASGRDKQGNNIVFHRETGKDKWQELKLENFEGRYISPLSFSKDNENIYLSANVGDGTRALYNYNIKLQTTKKLFHDEQVDMTLFIRDFSDKRIVAVGTDLDLPNYFYLDKKDFKSDLHMKLLQSFRDSDIMISSTTDDESLAVVYVYSDKNPGDYYLFETKQLTAQLLVSKHPQIDPKNMATAESFNFKARDGKTINAYITKPLNQKGKLPLVVLPHGGPHGVRDYWGYDWEVQLLANRGYAVLQVNFRGSGGFGTSFEIDGYGNWGSSMQDDLTDATLDLINKGIVDSKRICIYGASYGGYAALTGAFKEPDLYKCAIGSMGVYSLPMMFEKGDMPKRESGMNYLKKVLGEDVAVQKQRSPVFNADKIKANVLLIHGAKDERVPIEQAELLKQAFDQIGKKYQWLKLSDEAHGYYDEENRKVIYTKILKFLDNNIGPKSK